MVRHRQQLTNPGQQHCQAAHEAAMISRKAGQAGEGSPMQRRTGLAGAHSTCSLQGCHLKAQTLQFHVTRRMANKGSSWVRVKWDETSRQPRRGHMLEDVIQADPFFGRSRVRFRVPPWVFEHNCT